MTKDKGDNQFFNQELETMQAKARENYYLEELKGIIGHAYKNAPSVLKKV